MIATAQRMEPVLILYCRGTGKYAFNVVAGAVESAPDLNDVPVRFPASRQGLLDAIQDALADRAAVIVGWSFYSPHFVWASQELAWVRERVGDDRVIHLAGGVHASADPEQTLAAGFDLVAVGEGEQIIVDLLRAVRAGEDPGQVCGMAVRREGVVARYGRGGAVDLDRYPPFAPRHGRFGPIEITRGCIYGCRFCQTPFMNKAKFRHRSVEVICPYVRMLKERGWRDYRFITPTALSYGSEDECVDLGAVEDLLASVRATIGRQARLFFGTFPSEVRPEHVTRESLALLKRYVDNDNLIIGAQSGSQRVLDASHRGHSVEAAIQAVRLTVEAGFKPNVDLLFGLPGETREDLDATLRLARELSQMGARLHAHTFMPLPGTPFNHAMPGTVGPEVQRTLDQLASRGRVYGQWRKQGDIARDLADRDTVGWRPKVLK
jgi:B12-binding domain/radical SAM domain protein